MLSDCCLSCQSVLSVCDVGMLWPNSWLDQDETWHTGRPRPRPHCVRCGPSSPSPQKRKGHSPQFLAYVCCGQTARCIKMPLGMGVGLGPGNFVLDGDPAPPPKKGDTALSQFSAYVAKRLGGSRCHLVQR